MRLFLSSYRAGKHDDKLLEFLNGINDVGVITNAKDYKTPEGRAQRVGESFDFFKSLGVQPTEIDLRPYFHKDGADKLLDKHRFIWLAGGNVFLLRRALKYTGLDKSLRDKVTPDKIILGGESAGAIIVGPTLKYSEVDTDEDSPNYIPAGYDKEAIWSGLNLVDFVPVPHYQTPDYIGIDDYIKNLEKDNIPHKKMTDDQAIVIYGEKEEFLK
jgi:dipeptidase E